LQFSPEDQVLEINTTTTPPTYTASTLTYNTHIKPRSSED
jgi:hypothetical protein